jgi:hypothetical protein
MDRPAFSSPNGKTNQLCPKIFGLCPSAVRVAIFSAWVDGQRIGFGFRGNNGRNVLTPSDFAYPFE